jgi:nucleotide-binding universal stress UspA family protein
MFRKIAVAYNESPEADHALLCAVQLAKSLAAELCTVTVAVELPTYPAFAGAADSSLSQTLANDRAEFYELLEQKARSVAQAQGVELQSHLVEGRESDAIVSFLRRQKTDLLVIGRDGRRRGRQSYRHLVCGVIPEVRNRSGRIDTSNQQHTTICKHAQMS